MKPFVVKTISVSGTALCVLYLLFVVVLSLDVSSQNWDTTGSSEYDLYLGEKAPNVIVVALYTLLVIIYLVPWFRYFTRIGREYNNPDCWPFDLNIKTAAKSILTAVYVLLTFGLLYNLVRLPLAQVSVEIDAEGFAYRDFDVLFFKWIMVTLIGTPIYGLFSLVGLRKRIKNQ